MSEYLISEEASAPEATELRDLGDIIEEVAKERVSNQRHWFPRIRAAANWTRDGFKGMTATFVLMYHAIADRWNPLAFVLEGAVLILGTKQFLESAPENIMPPITTFVKGELYQQYACYGTVLLAVALAWWICVRRLASYRLRNWNEPAGIMSMTGTFAIVSVTLALSFLPGPLRLIDEPWQITDAFASWRNGFAATAAASTEEAPEVARVPELEDLAEKLILADISAVTREITSTPGRRIALAKSFANIARNYGDYLQREERLYGVPESATGAIIVKESGGNSTIVSPKKAVGLMQIMRIHANGRDLRDPSTNIEIGSKVLRDELSKHGLDFPTALGFYNCSIKGNDYADQHIQSLDSDNFWVRRHHLPLETQEYVPTVIALEMLWRDWKQHGHVRTVLEMENGSEPPLRPIIGRVDWRPSPAPKPESVPRRPLLTTASASEGEGRLIHRVRNGEIASVIAARHRLSLAELEGLNPDIPNLNHIEPGDNLIVAVSEKY